MSHSGSDRARPDALIWAYFLALSLVWGSSFLFIKIGLDDGLQPLTLVTWRLVIAVSFLAIVVLATGARVPRSREALGSLFVLAVVNVALPWALITWGTQFIPSAVSSIFNGTVPLFTIVIAAFVLHDEPIRLNRLAGIGIGFLGAVLLASPNLGSGGTSDGNMALLGELAVAGGALSYAAATVYARHRITGRNLVDDPRTGPRPPTPVEIALPQVAIAAVLITALSVVVERPPTGGLVQLPPSLTGWFAVAWLGVLGSGVAYLLFFRLVKAWGATRTTLVTYVMPIVGIALGVIVLSEQLHPIEIVGAALIIGGLGLANASVGQRRLFGRAPSSRAATSEVE
jgi:drug/metabolite transporter (DMT)-like permease